MSKIDMSMDYIYVYVQGHLLRITSLPIKIFFFILVIMPLALTLSYLTNI